MNEEHKIIYRKALKFLCECAQNDATSKNIKTKFDNLCNKTGQYYVPSELFQKRTSRTNRVLLPFSSLVSNSITYSQLESFEGGVVVEFNNADIFEPKFIKLDIFKKLITKLGSDDRVSAIISIRNRDGSSSSNLERSAFKKLMGRSFYYKNNKVTLSQKNYMNYRLTQRRIKNKKSSGKGNDSWDGFLYVLIQGGQQDVISTNDGEVYTLFNPACEYASASVCLDINLTMVYFAIYSIDTSNLSTKRKDEYCSLLDELKNALQSIYYEHDDYSGDLLSYCTNHYCLSIDNKKLYDPIQLKKIDVDKFGIRDNSEISLDFTHNESVYKDKFYWDKKKKTILGPARPTNIFWSYHYSNMLQQNNELYEYFIIESERVENRKKLGIA